jgi:hypothetical protein
MAFTYIWNQFHIHRHKIILLSLIGLFFFNSSPVQAQRLNSLNKPEYDLKRFHYGFYLALPFTRYGITHSQDYVDQLGGTAGGSGAAVNAKNSPGFYTGLVLNVGIVQYLDFRFVPGVGFYNRQVEFTNMPQEDGTSADVVKSINSTMIELPLLLKYKSMRRSNTRLYLVAGLKPGIDMGSGKSDEEANKGLAVNKFDVALEYGVGLDMFYPFFKFAPELRFSHGLLNQHKNTGSVYSGFIQKQTNHNVTLLFFFE